MNRFFRLLMAAASFCPFALSVSAGAAAPGGGAVSGETLPIVHGSSTVELYAAKELASYLHRVTGRTFDTSDVLPPAPKPALVLATPGTLPGAGEMVRSLLGDMRSGSDGYAIAPSADGRTLYIVAYEPRGVLFGVYDYLRQRAGVGFFDDGERVPDEPLAADLLPPFETLPEKIVEMPKFDYRSRMIWGRYYGAKRGHPANWTFEDWVEQLRAFAQRRINSVVIYPVGYTRLWGDTQRRAFSEADPFRKDINMDAEEFYGAKWSAKACYGRSPEEITKLMQRVYRFGRDQLGLEFEYTFYLGEFEEPLMDAYPEGKWLNWDNNPRVLYYGVGGRNPILSFTDPRCKEYSQRFWKTFIETFGTDHRYWIAYREESRAANNPGDPDFGTKQNDAIIKEQEWIREIDPEAEFFHWDWHFLQTYLDKALYKKVAAASKDSDYPHEAVRASMLNYFNSVPADITIANVLTPGLYSLPPVMYPYNIVDVTSHYGGTHPWLIGSLLGYARQDTGYGGIFVPTRKLFSLWSRWAREDPDRGNRLRGIYHYNELVQVNPLLSEMVSGFAWSGKLPTSLDSDSPDEPLLNAYFTQRFGAEDGPVVRRCNAAVFHDTEVRKTRKAALFQFAPESIIETMRTPIVHTEAGLSALQISRRNEIIGALDQLVALRDSQRDNPLYRNEVVDDARTGLHTLGRYYLQEAIGLAAAKRREPEDREAFSLAVSNAHAAIVALRDILRTDPRFSLFSAFTDTMAEPNGNPLLLRVMLEHASGRIFGNYQHTDSPEFFDHITLPLLDAYLTNLQRTMDDPITFRIKKANQLDSLMWDLQDAFIAMDLDDLAEPPEKRHPADILAEWAELGDKR